jgi:hypothetical protein
LVFLTRLFEANGDEVIQMAMLDHFPTTVLILMRDFQKIDANDPNVRNRFLTHSREVVLAQLRRDDGGLFPDQEEIADQIRNASEGRDASPAIKVRWERMKKALLQLLDFLGSLAGPEISNLTVEECMVLLVEWLKGVKAPVSVYVASKGMVEDLPKEIQRDWKELGARECYPDAKIVHASGGHFGFLGDDRVVKSLQSGYV